MTVSALTNFITTWSPSISSTNHRIEVRNVTQGGNDLLAAVPMGSQAMWAGSVLAEVADATTGPLSSVALFFRILFHPIVAFPLSIISCAVKEHFYESSVKCPVAEQIKYYQRGERVDAPVAGTVSLLVEGQLRHFAVGGDMTWSVESSALFEQNGVMKRFHYRRLADGEVNNGDVREMDLDGARVRVLLDWEVEDNFTEVTVNGRTRYYKLGNEMAEPVIGTAAVRNPGGGWMDHHHLIGAEIPNEVPGCIKLKTERQVFHYDTGKELDVPTDGSRTFTIDGQVRHFATAKFTASPSHGLSGWINKIPRIPFKLPTRLSHIAVQALEFVNKNMSNVIRLALIVSGAVLLFFGHTAMALGALLAVSYEYLDHDLGVVPRSVSLFMEKWMPVISMAGVLITGSLFSQVMAGGSLLLMIPSVNLLVHQRISGAIRVALLQMKDQIIRWFFRGGRPPQLDELTRAVENHPLLEECDAPLVERRVMNAREIQAVLAAENDAYEINPAFMTKDFEPVMQLPENRNFTELTRLWDAVGVRWTEPAAYTRLFNRVTDDKRFILYVKERFPEAKRLFFENDWRLNEQQNRDRFIELQTNHRNQFQEWVQILAHEKGFRNKEEFVANWVKQQLQFYVGKINGDRPIEGEQHLLRDAVQNTARIIPFLLKPETTEVEKEDALVKIAVEGGDYCSLAMKRASKEVLTGFTVPLQNAAVPVDPHKAFEDEVRYTMQKARLAGVEVLYKELVSRLRENEEMQDTAEDVHLYEAVTMSLKRGLYPLSEEEMESFTLTELVFKETLALPLQVQLMEMFRRRLYDAMGFLAIDPLNMMRNKILDYLRAWVEGNNALSAAEKGALLNGALSNVPDQIADPDNHPKWQRLMMVILGMIREKRVVPVPVPAPARMPAAQLAPIMI